MKIGISCSALKWGGGLERYAMDLVRGLARRHIVPYYFARKFDRTLPEYDLVHPVPLTVKWVPGKMRDHLFSWKLTRARRREGIDVLIGCNRVRGSDIAICGGTHRGYLAASGRRARFWDRRQIRLERDQYAGARLIVAHSRAMADDLRTLYAVDPARIRVIYPPVDEARFAPLDQEGRKRLRAEFGFADDQVIFAFPSSSHHRKGLDVLRPVFEATNLPIQLAVAGRPLGPPGRNLRDLGYQTSIQRLYQAADFVILASDYEPFGLVGVESVLCGTPVVLATTVGCREVIVEDVCLSFDRGSRASLEQALAAAVTMAQAGTHRFAAPKTRLRYDPCIDAHVERLLDLAAPAAGRHGSSP